jgi:hypothetical protein
MAVTGRAGSAGQARCWRSPSRGLCGVLTLSYGSYGWAALFLLPAALNFAFGYWDLTIFYRLLVAPLQRRVRELEQSRAHLVDDSAARDGADGATPHRHHHPSELFYVLDGSVSRGLDLGVDLAAVG